MSECDTLGVTGVPLNCFSLFSYSRGEVGLLEVTFNFAVICNLDADCTYLREMLTS